LQNLFLIAFLDEVTLGRGLWFGILDGERVRALALVIRGRLCVPWAPDLEDAARIGRYLAAEFPPAMMVGPRSACDALWGPWSRGKPPSRFYNQRLYVCRTPPRGLERPGFRLAATEEWRVIAHQAAAMEVEDLGRDPHALYRELHEQAVRDRIRQGRTWVLEQDGEIVFQINVGTVVAPMGCQVGGTYVPPAHRGKGLAVQGMRALCRRLLQDNAAVTLHVNEANIPAVRTYERSGFVRSHPFRLLTVADTP
jgi:GNAT superfamily N-acetyltransferase